MCEDSSINITSVHVRKTRVVVDMVYGLVGLAAFALSVVACVFVTCCVCAKKREVNSRRNGKGPTCGLETSRVPTSLSLAEITSATMGFDRNRIVGEGATAKVYKGSLLSGGEVAVKEMERMLITGLACVHPNHVKRPTVKEAARILQGEAPLPALPARKPRVSIRPVFHDDSEEIRNFCAGRFSLELDDVPFMTPNSQFGKD
ncbi:hypothetical protein M0R45_026964 [Rubus argutus]|uniref:Uncharacterized protein n=1 Tax=Rubus argutus TaxID=59490 RepID=A0AAW1X1R8_RUBAR